MTGRLAWTLVSSCIVAALVALGADVATARPPRDPVSPRARSFDPGPSPVVFPAQRIPIRMTHDAHVQRLGMQCLDCHGDAAKSRRAGDDLLPGGASCDRCHGTDHGDLSGVTADATQPLATCATCHVGYRSDVGMRVARVDVPPPNLRFDHAVHHRRNIGCSQCHGAVDQLAQAGRNAMPRMRSCLQCHAMPGPSRGKARGECITCHLSRGGIIKTHFSSGKLVPPPWLGGADHGPRWIETHKQAAGANSRLCASCHQEKECTDCHDGRVRPRRIHPNDWLSQHGVASRMASHRCTSCHRQQSFCVTCHTRLGITQSGPYAVQQGRGRFHPPPDIWTDGPRRRGHHAGEARKNLEVCVGCHVERDCLACHATAARGGPSVGHGTSPHSVGFTGRCAQAFRRNPRACLVCHDPADPELARCGL